MPLLSIIIPVYNVESYLEECLNSILEQNKTNYEVILVNDASTDRSGTICDLYASKNENVKVIHLKKNSLLGFARNVGIREAKGKYIHFCDADDYYLKNTLEKIMDELTNNSIELFLGHFICKPEKGAFVCDDVKFSLEKSKINKQKSLIQAYLDNLNIMGTAWRFIIKKELIINNNLYFLEGYYAEDEEWFPRVICSTNKISEVKTPFYCYRPRKNGSITSIKTFLHSKSQLKVAINLLKFVSVNKNNDLVKKFIFSRVDMMLGLFTTRCDTFLESEIHELAKIIEEDKNILYELKEINERVEFYKSIKEFGVSLGLKYYCKRNIEKTVAITDGIFKDNIYIFPTGYNGEATARILKDYSIKARGFLDNSNIKQGQVIEELMVESPLVLNQLDDNEIKDVIIILSTQKKSVIEILKKQLFGLRIKENQITYRIY